MSRIAPMQKTEFDYARLIREAKKETEYINFSSFIDEKIHDLRDAAQDGNAHSINRSSIAKSIGIDSSTLTKIINGSQATRKRDIIIALCFALKLSVSEAALALNLYPMAPLNCCNMRDLVIQQALCDGLSISELNNVLEDHGFPRLNVSRRSGCIEEHDFYYPLCSTSYSEDTVKILPYCVAGDDSDLSLHERYLPNRFSYHSEMIVRAKEQDGHAFQIVLAEDGHYSISIKEANGWRLMYSDNPFEQKYDQVCQCKDAELLREIAKLKEYRDRRTRYVHGVCNDTRNYGSRFDAVNDHGQLVIYGESFATDYPELCEYFQIEVSSSGCVFTVSNTSRFLKRYLGEDKWVKLYGPVLPPVNQGFRSLNEISDPRWQTHFQKLLDSAWDLLMQIQQREVFLFNARAWFDVDDLIREFHLEQEFDCIPSDGYLLPQKEEIMGSDGNPVTIDDLYRAAELDIYSLDELCAIRSRCGSLEQFLKIDLLNERKGNNHEKSE